MAELKYRQEVANVGQIKWDWKVTSRDLMEVKDIGAPLFSRIFGDDQSVWRLELYPRGFYQPAADHLSLFLNLQYSTQPRVTANFHLSLLNGSGRRLVLFNSDEPHVFHPSTPWGFNKFYLRPEDLKQLGDVQFHCEILIVPTTSSLTVSV